MQRPPAGVRMTIEAVCIMRNVKPKKVAGDQPGKKVDDYWEPGKALLQDPGKFLESLFTFDKVDIVYLVCSTSIYIFGLRYHHVCIYLSGRVCSLENCLSSTTVE